MELVVTTIVKTVVGEGVKYLLKKIYAWGKFKWDLAHIEASIGKRIDALLRSLAIDGKGYVVRLLDYTSYEEAKVDKNLKTKLENKFKKRFELIPQVINDLTQVINKKEPYLVLHVLEQKFTLEFYNSIFLPSYYTDDDKEIVKLIRKVVYDEFLIFVSNEHIMREILFKTNATKNQLEELHNFIFSLRTELDQNPGENIKNLIEKHSKDIDNLVNEAGMKTIDDILYKYLESSTEMSRDISEKIDDLGEDLEDLKAEINDFKVMVMERMGIKLEDLKDLPEDKLEETILKFLRQYRKWWFNATRIRNWGSRQAGYKALNDDDLLRTLDEMAKRRLIRSKPSLKGSWSLYRAK